MPDRNTDEGEERLKNNQVEAAFSIEKKGNLPYKYIPIIVLHVLKKFPSITHYYIIKVFLIYNQILMIFSSFKTSAPLPLPRPQTQLSGKLIPPEAK